MKSIKERAKLASEDYACNDRYSAGFFTGYVEGATKQQAIDEEVRLKKSDDMTEAEYDRETEFADWYLKNGKSTPTFSDAIEWSRKQTIDEVCEYAKARYDLGYCGNVRDVLNYMKSLAEE